MDIINKLGQNQLLHWSRILEALIFKFLDVGSGAGPKGARDGAYVRQRFREAVLYQLVRKTGSTMHGAVQLPSPCGQDSSSSPPPVRQESAGLSLVTQLPWWFTKALKFQVTRIMNRSLHVLKDLICPKIIHSLVFSSSISRVS